MDFIARLSIRIWNNSASAARCIAAMSMTDKLTQRALVDLLVADIDAARRKTKTAHTDGALRRVRLMIEQEDWETAYVTHNLGVTRLKYLMSIGIWRAHRWLRKEEDRIERRGRIYDEKGVDLD